MTRNPSRRHPTGSSHRAARGAGVNPPSRSRPVRPAETTSSAGSRVPRSGSTTASTRASSSRVPTGSTSVASCPPAVSITPYPATFTCTCHQSAPRHSSGWEMRSACTRPGGTVCERCSSSPRRRRRPSGDCATEKPNPREKRCHAAPSTPTASGSTPASAANTASKRAPTTAAVTTPAAASTTATDIPERRIDSTRRCTGTSTTVRSGASGTSWSSP
ncbi:hypothetical protein NUM3379_34430 [Kineococcus sp. NUM-3379]